MKYHLAGIENNYSFELPPTGTLVCGRAVTSDLAIIDPTVSRHHADVSVGDGGVNVRDVGSSNGTFVNGVRIEQSFVVPGDTLTFGKVAFRVEAVADAPPPPPPAATQIPGATIVRQVPRTPARGLEESGKLQAAMAAADPAEKDRQKLAILLEVSKGLTKVADTDALLSKVADYVFQILEADRCAILLREADHMVQKVARDKRSATVAYQVPQSIVGTVVDENGFNSQVLSFNWDGTDESLTAAAPDRYLDSAPNMLLHRWSPTETAVNVLFYEHQGLPALPQGEQYVLVTLFGQTGNPANEPGKKILLGTLTHGVQDTIEFSDFIVRAPSAEGTEGNPLGLAVDPSDGTIYFGDLFEQRIYRATLE